MFGRGSTILSGLPIGWGGWSAVGDLFGRVSPFPRDAREVEALFDAFSAMLAASFLQDKDVFQAALHDNSLVQSGLLASIKSFAAANIADPALSPGSVANKFGISVRYVHKFFEKDGQTFGQYVLALRLDRVRFDLRNPLHAALTIPDVATRWGFRDMPSFYRNFKNRFNLTPGQARASS